MRPHTQRKHDEEVDLVFWVESPEETAQSSHGSIYYPSDEFHSWENPPIHTTHRSPIRSRIPLGIFALITFFLIAGAGTATFLGIQVTGSTPQITHEKISATPTWQTVGVSPEDVEDNAVGQDDDNNFSLKDDDVDSMELTAVEINNSNLIAEAIENLKAQTPPISEPEPAETTPETKIEEAPPEPPPTIPPSGRISFPQSRDGYPMPYYYNHLANDDEKRAYVALANGIDNMDKEVHIAGDIDADSMKRIFSFLLYDRPDIFWSENGYDFTSKIGKVRMVVPRYSETLEERDRLIPIIDGEARQIVDEASQISGDYGKVRHYYTRLAELCTYKKSKDCSDQTIEGAFARHEMVCAGFASAMQYLCYLSDIPCIYIAGTAIERTQDGSAKKPGRHAWNAIDIDGISTYCDATAGNRDNDQLGYWYPYLSLTSDDLANMEYSPDFPEMMPECIDQSLKISRTDGIFLDSYDETALSELIADYLLEDTPLYIECANAEIYDALQGGYDGEGLLLPTLQRLATGEKISIRMYYDPQLRIVYLVRNPSPEG